MEYYTVVAVNEILQLLKVPGPLLETGAGGLGQLSDI